MSDGKEITLLAQLTLSGGMDEEVRVELAKLVAAVRQEPGCVEYAAHVLVENPRRVLFYERWADQNALDVHRDAPALTAFGAAIGPKLAGAPELTFLTRLG